MSKIGVQVQDVFEAADRVLMSGQRPTIERVRQDLGRGSPNTVGPHLDAWYQELGQRLKGMAAPSSEEGGLPKNLLSLAQQLWQTARDEAASSLAEQQRQAEAHWAEETKKLEQTRQETRQQAQQLQQREADLNAHIHLLQEQLKLADQRLDESLRTQAEKEVQLEAVRRDNTEISHKKQVLEAEILRLRDEHELALRQLSSESHRQLTRWMAEVDRARQEKKQLEGESMQAQAALKQALDKQKLEQEQLRHTLEKQLATALENSQHHQQQWREALAQIQEQQRETKTLQQQVETLSQRQRNTKEWATQLTASLNASLLRHREQRQQEGIQEQEAVDAKEKEGVSKRLD